MPNDALVKIRREAKRIQTRTGKKYQLALKEAGRMYREGKISGTRKKKANHNAKKKPTRSTGRKISSSMGTIAMAKKEIKERLGWALATRATAKTKKEKKGMEVKIRELTKQYRALS